MDRSSRKLHRIERLKQHKERTWEIAEDRYLPFLFTPVFPPLSERKSGGIHDRRDDRISNCVHRNTPLTWNVLMFTRKHYEYLSDTILNDPDITEQIRTAMSNSLGIWFKRDFDNFRKEKWDKKWKNRFL